MQKKEVSFNGEKNRRKTLLFFERALAIKRKYVRIGITRQENLVSKVVRIPYFMALRHKKSENKYLFCRENGKNLSREGGSL